MSTEKPIVATEVGGTMEILRDGYNALLAEPNPESVAARMRELIENPEIRRRIAKNALKTAREKHSMDNLLKYEELLTGL